jgi:hypothetical protein
MNLPSCSMLESSSLRPVCKAGGSSVSMSIVGSRVSVSKPAVSSCVMVYDCTNIVKTNSTTAIGGAATARSRNYEGATTAREQEGLAGEQGLSCIGGGGSREQGLSCIRGGGRGAGV